MNLSQAITSFNLTLLSGTFKDFEIKGFSNNSAEIKKDFIFFAVPGMVNDGFLYSEDAVKNGAGAVIHAHRDKKVQNAVNIYSKNVRESYALFASQFYNTPSNKMDLIGITGTNGKTSTSFLIKSVFDENGIKTGLIGTIFYNNGKNFEQSSLTTPEAARINRLLSEMLKNNIKTAVLEASSHSISQHRIAGLKFKTKIFTNISHDHLDYHKTFEEYIKAKSAFFENSGDASVAIINSDDNYSEKIINNFKGKILTYGIKSGDIRIEPDNIDINGIKANIKYKGKTVNIESSLTGYFNLFNICAAYAVGIAYDFPQKKIAEGIKNIKTVPGRLERIPNKHNFSVFVDYAHTPDAVEKALKAVKPLTKGKIITVLGCGGDRDREKRPVMGKIARDNSELFIITSDNPRTENKIDIIKAIVAGIKDKNDILVTPERESAIRTAIEFARENDTVMLLGKGHEDYQVIGTEKIPFDDKQIALKYIEKYVP